MKVQSVWFEEDKISFNKAIKWLDKHGYVYPKVHHEGPYMKFRQHDPKLFKKDSFRMFLPKDGIVFILAQPKKIRRTE
jgi:hypothetical protein